MFALMALFGTSKERKYLRKFENAILYFSKNCEKVGKLKLAKLLYFMDFNHYEQFLEPITWSRYDHIKNGPVPENFYTVFNSMRDSKAIIVENIPTTHENEFEKIIPNKEPNLGIFTKNELSTIKAIVDKFKYFNAEQMKEAVQKDYPCKITKIGENIPYQLALHR